jgi:hypothetical protein
VRAAGAEPLIVALDLAEASAAREVVDQTLAAFGRMTGATLRMDGGEVKSI